MFSLTRRRRGLPPVTRPRRSDAGVTLVEVTIAIMVLTVATTSALSTLVASTVIDKELKERSVALRAAVSKMETVLAYDYAGNIDNLVSYWAQSSKATFAVAELRPTIGQTGQPDPQGSVAIDATDHNRIVITVTIRWLGTRGARTFALPMVVTEVKP